MPVPTNILLVLIAIYRLCLVPARKRLPSRMVSNHGILVRNPGFPEYLLDFVVSENGCLKTKEISSLKESLKRNVGHKGYT